MYLDDIIASGEKVLVVLGISAVWGLFLGIIAWFLSYLFAGRENFSRNQSLLTLILASFVFGMFAFVFGLTMSASRTGAVANVVPAALTFLGGLALWLITKEKANAPVIAVCVLSFSAMFLFGTVSGSYERQRAIQASEKQRYDLKILKDKADAEYVINVYRKSKRLKPINLN